MSPVKTFVAAGVLAVMTCASPPVAAAPGHPPAGQALQRAADRPVNRTDACPTSLQEPQPKFRATACSHS